MENYITTAEAIRRAGVSRPTIIAWCREYGIGFKVGGRWRVDGAKLNDLLKSGSCDGKD